MLSKEQQYKNKLLQKKDLNYQFLALKFLLLVVWAIGGEIKNQAGSRIFFLLYLLWTMRSFNQNNRIAITDILRYEAQVTFRKNAALGNVEEMQKYLKDFGMIKINCVGPSKKNALHFAVRARKFGAVLFLLETQEKLNKELQMLQGWRLPDILNQQDYEGNTPLHIALIDLVEGRTLNRDIYELLLSYKTIQPKYELKNNEGQTLYDLEALLGAQKEIVSELKSQI